MQLTCPSCSTHFRFSRNAFGPRVRKVRCSSCRHIWHQEPVHEMQPIVELDSGMELAPVPDSVANMDAEDEAPPPRAAPDSKTAARKSKRSSNSRVRAKLSRGGGKARFGGTAGQAAGWALFALLLAGLTGSAVVYRQQIIDYLPPDAKHQAADVYDWAGLPFELPGYGLKIEVTQSSRQSDDDVSVLVIEGKITNISGRARSLPRLRAALRDQQNRELQQWFVRLAGEQLLSGQTASFKTSIDNPADDARHLSITFARSE